MRTDIGEVNPAPGTMRPSHETGCNFGVGETLPLLAMLTVNLSIGLERSFAKPLRFLACMTRLT